MAREVRRVDKLVPMVQISYEERPYTSAKRVPTETRMCECMLYTETQRRLTLSPPPCSRASAKAGRIKPCAQCRKCPFRLPKDLCVASCWERIPWLISLLAQTLLDLGSFNEWMLCKLDIVGLFRMSNKHLFDWVITSSYLPWSCSWRTKRLSRARRLSFSYRRHAGESSRLFSSTHYLLMWQHHIACNAHRKRVEGSNDLPIRQVSVTQLPAIPLIKAGSAVRCSAQSSMKLGIQKLWRRVVVATHILGRRHELILVNPASKLEINLIVQIGAHVWFPIARVDDWPRSIGARTLRSNAESWMQEGADEQQLSAGCEHV